MTDTDEMFITITEEGMSSNFPKDQIASILALALIAWCGNDVLAAAKILGQAWNEHEAFAKAHPELKPH